MRNGKEPASVDYQLSKHAEIRAQQRGIRQQIIGLVADHADQRLHAGNGLVSLRLSRRCLRDLGAAGINTSLLERAKGVVVLMCPQLIPSPPRCTILGTPGGVIVISTKPGRILVEGAGLRNPGFDRRYEVKE